MPITTRGWLTCTRDVGARDEMPEHLLVVLKVGDHPMTEGRIATMSAGVRPSMRRASVPTPAPARCVC